MADGMIKIRVVDEYNRQWNLECPQLPRQGDLLYLPLDPHHEIRVKVTEMEFHWSWRDDKFDAFIFWEHLCKVEVLAELNR